jgi:uncharacterized protein
VAAPGWVQATAGGSLLIVHVRPGARRSEIVGLHGGALCLRVRGRPVEGAANREVLDLLAKTLGVPAGAVSLRAGARGRDKRVAIEGLAPEGIVARLGAARFVDKTGPHA